MISIESRLEEMNSTLLAVGNDWSDVLLDAVAELATLRTRAELAEADLREYRNLCEVLMEGNRSSIKLASDLLIAESTIAGLRAFVEKAGHLRKCSVRAPHAASMDYKPSCNCGWEKLVGGSKK